MNVLAECPNSITHLHLETGLHSRLRSELVHGDLQHLAKQKDYYIIAGNDSS